MANFTNEFIKAVAHGDKEALAEANGLTATQKISLGTAVDEVRRKENIIPVGNFMFEEKQRNTTLDDEALGDALAKRLQEARDKEEKLEREREESLKKQVEADVKRARSRLPRR